MIMKGRWFAVLALASISSGISAGDSPAAPAEQPAGAALTLSTGLEPAAAGKIDPRIRFAMAMRPADSSVLAPMGRRIVLLGKSAEEIEFPVLIRTRLSDAQLAAIGAPPDSRAGEIVTARVAMEDLAGLAADPGVEAIEASAWLSSDLDVSIPEIRANLVNQGSPPTGYTGAGVIFGLIDDGIDITHADFKNAQNTSRILYIWDNYRDGKPPAGFDYGWEYTKADIDNGLANQFVNDGGHGSHVAGIAVGDGSSLAGGKYRGVAADADIIAVRNGYCDMFCYGGGMPPYGNPDTKGSIDGLNYLLDKRTQLGKPLIVNQSQGVTMGPHDGTTLFERAYDELVANENLIICVAAGNDQEHNWHGQTVVPAGGSGTIVVNSEPGQAEQPVFLTWECWYREGDLFNWRLTTPGGASLDIDASYPPEQYPGYVFPGQQDTLFYWATASSAVNGQGYASFWIQNRTLGPQDGDWTVTATAANGLPAGGVVDLYCERNQRYLQVKPGQGLNTDGIVGMPGTSGGVITIASYNTKNQWDSLEGPMQAPSYTIGDISPFSSWGPRRDGARKPDVAAPGAWIMSAFAAGSDPFNEEQEVRDPQGKHICFTGTSMASPHVAGAVALMLQKQPALSPAEVKQILQQTARTDNWTGAVWNKKFGYGKIDVKAAVDAVGGGAACLTRAGDADGNNAVDVLDLVATVNDILGTEPLGSGARACVDLDENDRVNVLDVVSIVNIILGFFRGPAAISSADEPGPPVDWTLQTSERTIRIEIDARRVAGAEMTVTPPRGHAFDGGPRLARAASGAEIAWSMPRGMCKILAFNPAGEALGELDAPLVIELPIRMEWHSGQDPAESRIDGITFSDLNGRFLQGSVEPVSTLLGFPDPGADRAARTAPNPTRGVSAISYSIERSGEVDVEIYDAQGRKVRRLWKGWQMAGDHILNWDGRTDDGVESATGTYFVRLRMEGIATSEKLTLIR